MAATRIWRHRTRRTRHWIILFAAILTMIITVRLISLSVKVFITYHNTRLSSEQKPQLHIVRTERCSQPQLDPRNQLFDRFDRNVSLICPIEEVILTSLNQSTGILSLDLKAIDGLRINCSYSFITRRMGSDDQVIYSKPHSFRSNGSITLTASSNTVNVSCFDGIGDKIYANAHIFVPKFESSNRSSPAKPNVLVLLLGSLSRLTFDRLMKRTEAEMTAMKFQYLNYFVTQRNHSLYNTMALLTGVRMGPASARSALSSYFDRIKKLKFLWQSFRDKNYTTAVISDMGNAGLFHPSARGFRTQPVDFYPSPFWNHVTSNHQRRERYKPSLRDFCHGMNGYKVEIFLDQVLEFVGKNHKSPYFMLASFTQMTRSDANNFKIVDPFIAEFFKKLKPLLWNTIVVFAGDYGLKDEPYVATSIGRLEERMSLFSVLVPNCVSREHHHLRTLLSLNSNHLTSWLDAHVMLNDIAEQEFHSVSHERRRTIGMNPMRQEIPADRSCDDAGIDDDYCVCGNHVYLDLQTTSVKVDIISLNRSLHSYLGTRCLHKVPPVTLKYAYYDIEKDVTGANRDRASVCFVTGNFRTRFSLDLTRDWKDGPDADFKIVPDNFDERICE